MTTEITRERISEILRVAFDLLWFEPAGLYLHEILENIGRNFALTDEERNSFVFAPRFPRYEVIIRIGSIPLVKAGWLEKSKKGKWRITEKGRQESKQYANAEDFFVSAIHEYEEWKNRETARKESFDYLVIERAEERAWQQIGGYMQSMSATEVRDLVGELLKALGYYVVWTAPPEKSRGQAHLIVRTSPFGVNGGGIVVHVHEGEQAATVENLHAFMSMLNPHDHGLFFSLAGFTARVREEMYGRPESTLRLMELDEFIELWLRNQSRLSPEARNRLPLKPVYFLQPPEI
jgi:restriction system protein